MGARRMSLTAWLGYAGAFFVAWFLSAGIFANFPMMGSLPNLLPVCIAFVAVLEGSLIGSLFGLFAGVFSWLAQGDEVMIFLGAVIGMVAGLARSRRPWLGCMVSALLALILVNGLHLLAGGGSPTVMVGIAGWEVAYSMLLALPVYPMFRFVRRRPGVG